MGGHGALTIALKNQNDWVSVSAFSPICNPTQVPWGEKAFRAYFGSIECGKAHDATCLLTDKSKKVPTLGWYVKKSEKSADVLGFGPFAANGAFCCLCISAL